MVPWHPALVHFPIALAGVAVLFELLAIGFHRDEYERSALIALGAAALMAIVAAVSGTAQEEAASHLPGIAATLEMHENLGTLSAALLGVCALGGLYLHLKGWLPQKLYLAVLLALSILLLATGHWGGRLVYYYGAGTPNILP
jgi:uncharacterized membrane protein